MSEEKKKKGDLKIKGIANSIKITLKFFIREQRGFISLNDIFNFLIEVN